MIKLLNVVSVSKTFGFMVGAVDYFRRRGFTVGLASTPGEMLDELSKTEDAEKYEVEIRRDIAPIHDLVSLFRLIGIIRHFRPQVINSSNPKGGLLGTLAAWICRVPVRVYQVRGLRYETTHGLKRQVLIWMERLACRCAHSVICNSPSVRRQMIADRLVSSAKAHVLGHGSAKGVNPVRYSLSAETLAKAVLFRQKHSIPADAFLIGFVGRLLKEKGIEELYEAFLRLPQNGTDLRLVLIGGGDPGPQVAPEIMRQLRSDPRVIMTGEVNDVENYLSALDLLAFPSWREGFPNAVLEAASMGLPVIGFDVTGVCDAIVDETTGRLVPAHDIQALADAFTVLETNHKMRFSFASAARLRCMTDFQPAYVFENFTRHYVDLLCQKKIPLSESLSVANEPELLDPSRDQTTFRVWSAVKLSLLNGIAEEEIFNRCSLTSQDRPQWLDFCERTRSLVSQLDPESIK